MRKYRVKQDVAAPEKTGLEALAKLQAEQQEFLARGERATLAELEARMLRYETVLEKIPQGICFFGADQRLLLSNRRYAEIYHLAPEDVKPGTTLRAITERRVALGTCLMTVVDDYLRWCEEVNSGAAAKTWTAELKDGRTIHISHQRMPDGGWVATHDDITQLKPKRAVVNELISLQALIDFVPDYLWVKDTESHFLVVNKALTADSGRARTSDLVGLSDFDIHAPDLAEGFFAREQEIFRSGESLIDFEEHVLDAKGAPKWLLSTKVPLRNERNEIFGLVGIARDITERRQADTLRNGQAQILEMIARSADLEDVLDQLVCLIESQLNGIFGSVLLLDEDGQTLRHGAAPSLAEAYSRAIDGAKIGPTVGSCGTAIYHRKPVIVSDIMNDPLWADYRGLAAAHGYRSCWSTPILAHDGSVLGAFAMYSTTVREPTPVETRLVDIAVRIAGIAIERKHAEDRIRFLAHHDVLTGLPNRSLLNDRLTQAILQTQRHNPCVSVVFVDLDHFKNINDSLGHDAGDQLLKVVAARMVAAVRATDTVMRLGGDEFIILLSDQPDNPSMISATLNRIRATVAEPVVIEGRTLYITCSMGVATYPADSENPETLVRNADAAMYKAKDAGRDNVQFYTSEMNARIQEKLMLQKEIRDAIVRSQFILDYQPQIELRSGRIFAAEALIRWQHPTQGLLSPIKFIPIAEETGLIVQVGDWVLHEACRQNKAWQDQGLPPISVCVNVSARQFREKNLISRVVSALRESGLEAKFLELEITESLIMHDVDQAVATMQALRKLGVQLAIDDFGTGYSSLNALKTFPVARLKIDKSFISNITSSERDKAVASAVISLGQKLNLKVIAEGVETAEQVEFLRANNCDEIQGYHISRPVGSEAIAGFLKSQSATVL